MPNLSVKDVPEAWAQALRMRAARNHRSLQGELMALIQDAVAPEFSPLPGSSPVPDRVTPALADSAPTNPGHRGDIVGFDRFGNSIVRRGWKTVEQIAAEMRAQPSDPVQCRALPKGVDIIREEREAR
jgi:hypothetical protein